MAKNNLGALYSNATILLHANASMKLWYGVEGKRWSVFLLVLIKRQN